MLVGEGVTSDINLGSSLEDLLAHLVHSVLDRCALVLSESFERDGAGSIKGGVEALDALLDGSNVGEGLPGPSGINIGGEDAVPGLAEGGVLIADEAVEGGAGALEDLEARDGARELDTLFPRDSRLDVAGLLAVTVEAVGVGLSVNVDAGPTVDDDLDVGNVDVGVLVEEVLAEVGDIELWGVHGVLLGLDVDGVLDGVGGNDNAVVSLGVGGLDLALEKAADGHLSDGLRAGGFILVDLVDADIVLAIASSSEAGHGE